MFEQFTRRRRTGKVARLPEVLLGSVEKMLLAGVTYREIVEYLRTHDEILSRQAVCNYARKFLATTQQLRMAQENYKVLLEEMKRMPEVDMGEAILRVMGNALLNRLANASPEEWQSMNFATVVKESNILVKVASHKRRTDALNTSEVEKALDAIQLNAWHALKDKEPQLLEQFSKAIQDAKSELAKSE